MSCFHSFKKRGFWVFFAKVYVLYFTAKNTLISPTFLVLTIYGKAPFAHSFGRFAKFPQNFYTRKLGEITLFFSVFIVRPHSVSRYRNSSCEYPQVLRRIFFVSTFSSFICNTRILSSHLCFSNSFWKTCFFIEQLLKNWIICIICNRSDPAIVVIPSNKLHVHEIIFSWISNVKL